MNPAFKVFTIESGKITEGTKVESYKLKSADVTIPVIKVGEDGRGRKLGLILVENLTMDEDRKPMSIAAASFGQTQAGNPKLIAAGAATSGEKIIVVFRTKIGFRGSNEHTGDRTGWKCRKHSCDAHDTSIIKLPAKCPKCGAEGSWDAPKRLFAPLPGETLVEGIIADGAAGRAGSGQQLIALMPKNTVFRTAYSGRLYGAPAAHYYRWDGATLQAATWEERELASLWFPTPPKKNQPVGTMEEELAKLRARFGQK